MKCPNGHDAKQLVIESRPNDEDGKVYRRRYCCMCNKRYTTVEQIQDGPLPRIRKQRDSSKDWLFKEK